MIVYILCIFLFLVGLYGVIAKRNLIKIVIGIAIMEYSINLFLILIAYVKGGTAPIVSGDAGGRVFVDPLPRPWCLPRS